MMKDCKDGANSAVIAAVSPAFKGCSGVYISDGKCTSPSKLSRYKLYEKWCWGWLYSMAIFEYVKNNFALSLNLLEYRNVQQQERLWDYTIGLLKEYLSEDSLKFVEEN